MLLNESLKKWIDESIHLMSNKLYPNDFIELKSLIADIKTFRLVEYATHLADKKKLSNIYSELQVLHSKQIPIESNQHLILIDKLWEKLDIVLHNRENLLENALAK